MNEIIDALRNCSCADGSGSCSICQYVQKERCKQQMMDDAADAIEWMTDEIDRKDKALQAWVKTWEQRKENAIRHICEHCDTPIDVRLKEGACEDCPIITLVKEIFDEQQS